MCKVMMIAGIKRQHQEKVKKLSAEMIKVVSNVDDDGFGYAAITRNGKIYGEKWLNKDDVFRIHAQPKPDPGHDIIKESLGDAVKFKENFVTERIYDSFGEINKESMANTVAIIVHARRNTIGAKNILNTHPFVELGQANQPDTAIIHNGQINNHLALTKKYSTCDSEVILHEYISNQMWYNPYAMTSLAKTLQGEYTVGALSSVEYEDGTIEPIMDIFKSNKDLHVAYVKELETLVFCTTQYALETAVKNAGMTCSGLAEVKDGFLMRFNAATGEKIEDLIPFELSQKWTTSTSTHTGGNTQIDRHHRTVHPINAPVRGTFGDNKETLVDVSEKFAKHNADLFSSPYYQPGQQLTEKEQEYFAELEKDPKANNKALRLVKKVMNL